MFGIPVLSVTVIVFSNSLMLFGL